MNESRDEVEGVDREGTKARLMAAARRLFAQRGYRGASVRAITTEAGANLGAITYHFGSKQALYEATLEQCLEPVRRAIADVMAAPDGPLARIEGVLRVFFDHLQRNPDVPQFMLQEVAAGETPSPPVQRTLSRVLGGLASLIEEGQREGAFRPCDPRLTAVSIVAQPVHLTLLGQLLKRQKGKQPMLPVGPDILHQHAAAFVRGALEAREGSGRP